MSRGVYGTVSYGTRTVVGSVIRVGVTVILAASFFVLAALGLGPRTGRYRTLTVLSGSMRPSIPPGSVVIDTPMPLRDLHVGDVITYQAPVDGQPVVTHRIIQIVQAGDHPVVRTKGDANTSPDPWVARLDGGTAWRVRSSVPAVGYAIHVLRSPQAARLILGVVPLLLAVVWLIDIWTPGAPQADDDPDGRSITTS